MGDSSLGAWIILDWNGMMEPFGKDFFFADAVHIGFFTRPGRTVFGLMMSGPQAGRQASSVGSG